MIDTMARLLHNAGMNALSVPFDKSADLWNSYRFKIAAELIADGVGLPDRFLIPAAPDSEGRCSCGGKISSDCTGCPKFINH